MIFQKPIKPNIMIKLITAYTAAFILLGLCIYARFTFEPSQPKPQHQGLPQYVIPLLQYYDSRSATGLSWQPMDRYVWELREGGLWWFIGKFPKAPEWYAKGRLRFCCLAGHNRAEIVTFAQQGYTFFQNNPPIK